MFERLVEGEPVEKMAKQPVAVIGAGSIGSAFALLFARAGHPVRLFDVEARALDAAIGVVEARLAGLEAFGLLDEPPASIVRRIATTTDLTAALEGAILAQECAPERLDVKRRLFTELDRAAAPPTILASASSAIRISEIASDLAGRGRCLVVHPGNPPFLLPVAEIVPAPFTAQWAVDAATALLAAAGMVPVRLEKEVPGFLFNRLQGAVLREAYCLVRDGVASVEAIDAVMKHGLGRRWSLIGPFETADLNIRGGIEAHAQRMGEAYARMGAERGQHDPWTPELVAEVTRQRRAILPLDAWEARVAWRDRALMALEACRRRQPDLFDER